TVRTGDAEHFAARELEVEVLEEDALAVARREVLDLQDLRAGAFAGGQVEVHDPRPLVGPIQAVQPLEPLQPARRLARALTGAVAADVLRLLVDEVRLFVVLAPRG